MANEHLIKYLNDAKKSLCAAKAFCYSPDEKDEVEVLITMVQDAVERL